MDDAIPREAPRSDDLDLLPRFAASAAPAAICCFLDLAGMHHLRARLDGVQMGRSPTDCCSLSRPFSHCRNAGEKAPNHSDSQTDPVNRVRDVRNNFREAEEKPDEHHCDRLGVQIKA